MAGKILSKFITVDTLAIFLGANYLNSTLETTIANNGYVGNIPYNSIVFIKDLGILWSHGKYFGKKPTAFNISASATSLYWSLTGTGGSNSVSYTLAPYSSKLSTASFYTGTTAPSGETRLNYNGYLYATAFSGKYFVEKATSWTSSDRTIPFSASGADTTILYVNNNSSTGLTYNPSTGALKAGSFIKRGGTSSQFLKADGTVDSTTYASTDYVLNALKVRIFTVTPNFSLSDTDSIGEILPIKATDLADSVANGFLPIIRHDAAGTHAWFIDYRLVVAVASGSLSDGIFAFESSGGNETVVFQVQKTENSGENVEITGATTTTLAKDSEVVHSVTSTDNAIVRFDGTSGAIQNSGVTIDDSNNLVTAGNIQGKNIIVRGTNTSNTTRFISSDAVNNIYMSVNGSIPAVFEPTCVRPARSNTSANLGDTTTSWNNIYAKKFITNGGTSSQFVKGDGTLDSTTYASTTYVDNALKVHVYKISAPPLASASTPTGTVLSVSSQELSSDLLNGITPIILNDTFDAHGYYELWIVSRSMLPAVMGTLEFQLTYVASGVMCTLICGNSQENLMINSVSYYDITQYAPLASPTLTGTPKAPTAAAGTSTTLIATTAFVLNAISTSVATLNGVLQYVGLYTPTASGTNTAPVIDSSLQSTLGTTLKKGYTWIVGSYSSSSHTYFLGTYVEPGDMIIALVDNPGTTIGNYNVIQKNLNINDYVTITGSQTISGSKTFSSHITSSGFIKSDSSDSYVLLGGGGHILLSNISNVTTSAVISDSATGVVLIAAAQSNPYYNLLEGGSVSRSIQFKAGTGMSISSATDGVITFTNTVSNTNTWRNIYTSGTSRVGTANSTKAINFAAESPLSVSYLAAGTGSGQSGSADYFTIKVSANLNRSGSAGFLPAPPEDTNNNIWMTNTSETPSWKAVTSNSPTLAWGETVEIGSVGDVVFEVTMPSNPNTDNDTKVTQTKTASSNTSWQPLLLGYSSSNTTTFNPATVTNTTYATHLAKFKPSTGVLAIVGLNKMTTSGTVETGSNSKVWNTNGTTTDLGPYATSGPLYWANLAIGTSTNYITEPEVKSIKINGSTTNSASSTNCELLYDTTNKCLNFVFN